MTDTSKEELKRELKALYPDFTDEELNEAKFNLVSFFQKLVEIDMQLKNEEEE